VTNDDLPLIHGGPRPVQPTIPTTRLPEEFVTPLDKIVYGTLVDPITPEYFKNVTELENKRRDVLKKAKRIEKLGKKLEDDITKAQDMLKRARNLEEKYVNLLGRNDGGDPLLIRNLEFTVSTAETLTRMYIKNPPYVDKNRDKVRATPVENIVAAKELLENNQTLAALDTVVKLMSKALGQQEKSTSSRRLASDVGR
jgi:hypothetical protein